MMNLEKYQIITLEDNNEYMVIDSIIYDDKNFLYLTNTKNPKDQLIALSSKINDEITIEALDYEGEENKEILNELSNLFLGRMLNPDMKEDL